MKRSIARGRIVPQSRSTDPRLGRVSLKAVTVYDRMWINCDDQGRCSGDPDEIKYTACPNLPDISKEDIPRLLKELAATNPGLIKVYTTSKTEAIQMLDWWEVQRLQWAWPSEYPPPEGWQDRLRYKKSKKEVVTINWGSPESSPENTPERSPENSPENSSCSPLTTLSEKEEEEEEERGRGISPESSGEKSSPSLTGLPLFEYFNDVFPKAFGRKPDSRETAQLRDLGKEISSAGGASAEQVYDAFREAAVQNKLHVSYIRAVLHAWLGLERGPPLAR